MAEYELAPAAVVDLMEIATYTLTTWGSEQADVYGGALESHFRRIARSRVLTSTAIPGRPELRVSRCRHHYVFSLVRPDESPLILAVLHENMDLMARLRDRLGTTLD